MGDIIMSNQNIETKLLAHVSHTNVNIMQNVAL